MDGNGILIGLLHVQLRHKRQHCSHLLILMFHLIHQDWEFYGMEKALYLIIFNDGRKQ